MKKHIRFTAALLALGLCVSTAVSQIPVSATEETAADTSAQVQTADPSIVTTNGIAGWPQATDISSTAAVVMEISTNTVLYSKNADQALYPASAVKIMTCLLVLENSSLDDQVTMTATGVSGVTDGGANISAQLDEVFTMEQCLYAIMVASANDIALQVAEHISGSVDAFVAAMNARAQELGCTNTVFTNPTGLPDENQHITAHDMALIMEAAMANDTFRTIAATTSYTIPATNVSGGDRVLTNNFTMINNTSDGYYEACIGGKEGYTQASGSTAETCMKDSLNLNPQLLEYGSKLGEIQDFAIRDDSGMITNVIEKGKTFSVEMKVSFQADVNDPIFAFTLKDLKGTEITGTNTMYEHTPVKPQKAGDVRHITFTQVMPLEAGEYMLCLGCTGYKDGDFTVFHRLYDVCNLTVITDKKAVGYFDMFSRVSVE